jgi:hypothetical protein
MVVTEVIEVPRTPAESFAYVADFTTVAEWDPGIHASRRVSGDGGTGSVYEVQAGFRGKTMTVSSAGSRPRSQATPSTLSNRL